MLQRLGVSGVYHSASNICVALINLCYLCASGQAQIITLYVPHFFTLYIMHSLILFNL